MIIRVDHVGVKIEENVECKTRSEAELALQGRVYTVPPLVCLATDER